MKYYIDENGLLYDKDGIDYRVKKRLQTLDGFTIATNEQVKAFFAEFMDTESEEFKNLTMES